METKTREQNPEEDKTMRNLIKKLVKDESGQDVAEYAIALAIVALAAAGVGASMKTTLSTVWSQAQADVTAAM